MHPTALSAINIARAAARAQAWTAAGTAAPNHDRDARHTLIIDLDATLVTAHSDKEKATPNWEKGVGFHRCVPSPTTKPPAPANHWPSSYGPATPGRTPLPITSASSRPRWPRCRAWAVTGSAQRC